MTREGPYSSKDSLLASHPVATGSILGLGFEICRQHFCLEMWKAEAFNNVEWTHTVSASRKLVLQKVIMACQLGCGQCSMAARCRALKQKWTNDESYNSTCSAWPWWLTTQLFDKQTKNFRLECLAWAKSFAKGVSPSLRQMEIFGKNKTTKKFEGWKLTEKCLPRYHSRPVEEEHLKEHF